MKVLETDRLLVMKINLDDASFILELLNSESWIRYIGDRKVRTVREAEEYLSAGILKSYAEKGFGFYKLLLKEGSIPIGICGFVKRAELEDVDIGFAMLPGFEGKGYGYESASALLKYGKEILKFKRISAITIAENNASINLIEKIGLTFEKTIFPFDEKEELLLFAKDL